MNNIARFNNNNGDEVMMINPQGDVGIGTTSPGAKLEVVGKVKATAFEGDGSALAGVGSWSQKLPAADRFELVLDGAAVLDKETGLVWEQSPDTTQRTWTSAISHCYTREVGGRKGWHLPTVEQLASLVDSTQSNPALPSGHPFSNVQSSFYWSSTTSASGTTDAWVVGFFNGIVSLNNKTNNDHVWCVRGGETYDAY